MSHDPLPGSAACKCHESFAYIAPFHSGHCCFFPPSQDCHEAEVALWMEKRDRHLGVKPHASVRSRARVR